MDFNTLKYFIDTYENKSFSRAAKINFVSQTAISQQILKLEDELDVKLFDRSKKPIAPTHTATVFYHDATQILNSYHEALSNVRDVNTNAVKLGYSQRAKGDLLSQLLLHSELDMIDVPVNFVSAASLTAVDLLFNNKVDLITTTEEEASVFPPSVCKQELYQGDLVLAINKHNPLSRQKVIKKTDLHHQYILTIANEFGKQQHEIAMSIGSQNIIHTGTDYTSVLFAVLTNSGVTLIPEYMNTQKYANKLVFKHVTDLESRVKIFLCWKKNDTKRLKPVINALQDAAEHLS